MTNIDYINNQKDRTIVSFTGIRTGFGINDFKKEFIELVKYDYNVLFVADMSLSWYNNLDVEKIISHLNGSPVITIGNSMGAYNAAQFAKDYPVSTAICFSTQYSVHPEISPSNKWRVLAGKIKNWKHKHLVFNNSTNYFFISNTSKLDKEEIKLIPDHANIHKILIKKGRKHVIASTLKRCGKLYDFVNSIINEEDINVILEDLSKTMNIEYINGKYRKNY